MLIKLQTEEAQTHVFNTDHVMRVEQYGARTTLVQGDGKEFWLQITADQYYSLVTQSTEMEQHENSKRLAKQLRAVLQELRG